MMIGALLVALLQPAPVIVCLRDAVTGAPVVGATVWSVSARVVLADACGRILPGTLRVSRVGYRETRLVIAASTDTLSVSLQPRTAPQSLETVAVRAATTVPRAGQVATSRDVMDARERGAGTTSGLLALLPYTQLRSARGETGLSLRGARREQVVVTLDGLPLNDPATGLADVSDIPLASLGSATVTPGVDPVGAGPGASGGVLALTTQPQQVLALRSAAFGSTQAEAAYSGVASGARWNAAASWRTARNDFRFVNDAGVAPVTETRINNDERRVAVSGGLLRGGTQIAVLASTGERGLVGPANVRAYDADRSRTTRAVLRAQQSVGSTVGALGIRRFALAYRDPARPALNTQADAWAADLEWRGTAPAIGRGDAVWRAGVGADGLTATSTRAQRRTRGFVATEWRRPLGSEPAARGRVDVGLRTDVVERHGAQPVGTIGLSWALGAVRRVPVQGIARVGQAIRVPTLYDLYFSNPQRLIVRPLDPERVTLDASVGLVARAGDAGAGAEAEVQLVSRDTRNAIVWFPGNFGWSPSNVGREQLRGVESRVALRRGPVHVESWATWYEATLRTNGLRIPTPYVPRVATGTQLRFTHRASSVSANARGQGRRPFTAGPRNTAFELPAVWLVDGAVSHHWLVQRTDVLVTVAVDNATDARWQSVRGFPMPGRAWSAGITLVPARQR